MNCHCGSAVPAEVVVRMIARRDVEPLNDDVRRSLAWPGVASPVDVPCCIRHLPETKKAARTVLGVRALGDAIEYRVLKDEKEPA